jgi:hypothetical protein
LSCWTDNVIMYDVLTYTSTIITFVQAKSKKKKKKEITSKQERGTLNTG